MRLSAYPRTRLAPAGTRLVAWLAFAALPLVAACEHVTGPNRGLHERWFVPLPGSNPYALVPRPAVAGDLVVFGTGDGRLQGLDAATGALRWETAAGAGPIFGTRIVHQDGVVLATTQTATVAVEAGTGRLLWRYAAPAGPRGASPAEPGFVGKAYLDADHDAAYLPAWGGTVSAVDLRTGRVRWVWSFGPALPNRAGVSGVRVSGDTVFATAWHWLVPNGVRSEVSLLALDRGAGRELWRAALPGEGSGTGPWTQPLVVGNRVVTGAADGGVVAVDRASGAVAWRADGASGHVAAVLDGGVVYVDGPSSVENGLTTYLALDAATGRPRWTVKLDLAPAVHELLVTARRVHVSTGSTIIVLDRASGRRVAEIRHPQGESTGGFASAPVEAAGRLFVHLSRTVTNGTPNVRYEDRAFSVDEP